MKVVIVGAGIIGLSCAYYLSADGHDVTLVDSGAPAGGASRHNAGWIVPSMSTPVAAPGMLSQAFKWLWRADSPLYIRPSVDPRTLTFLLQMAKKSSPRHYQAGAQVLSELNRRTLAMFDELREDGLKFEHHADPLTTLFIDGSRLEAHIANRELLDSPEDGQRWWPLDRRALQEEVPGVSSHVVGGITTVGDRSVDPEALMLALLKGCEGRGVEVISNTSAHLYPSGSRTEVRAGTHRWSPDRIVVAAGVWTNTVLRPLQERLVLLSGKGYGFDLPKLPGFPDRPLYLSDAKVAVTPLNSKVRFSGTMGFGGIDEGVDDRRARGILTSAQRYFSDWDVREIEAKPWTGLRPMTPDGVPFIGPLTKHPNVVVATGHQMLGVTLGPATGSLVADIVNGNALSTAPTALSASRTF